LCLFPPDNGQIEPRHASLTLLSLSRPFAPPNKVYCANGGSNNVMVIDGGINTVVATIAVGSYPCAFALNPVQHRVYVANQ